MTSTLIREARESDVVFLKRLLTQLGYPDQDEAAILEKVDQHRGSQYRLLIAEVDHEVVGFIALHWFHTFHLPGDMGRITAFCVDERFRSQGIGGGLLKAAEERLLTEGCKKIEVTSNARRTRTHDFYSSRGYTEDSRRFVKYFLTT